MAGRVVVDEHHVVNALARPYDTGPCLLKAVKTSGKNAAILLKKRLLLQILASSSRLKAL